MKKTNKTQVSDNTQLKQKLREAKAKVKELQNKIKKLENQNKEIRKMLESMETFLSDYTDHISVEEVIKITKKRNNKPKQNAKDKLKADLRKVYGRKTED